MKITSTFIATIVTLSSALSQDYKSYNQLLAKYVTADGVRYKDWSANQADHSALDETLQQWAKVDASQLSEKDRAAFRINLYNASVIAVVLDKYPLQSVTKIGVPFSVFKRPIVKTSEGNISLDTLEKKLLLADFPDPRVHFAVNCASVSCPPLRSDAYTGDSLEKQLQQQARTFAATEHAVQVSDDKVYYSSLYNWYQKDFGEDNPAQIINRFSAKKIPTNLKTEWIKYDWSLNEAQ